MIDVAMGTFNTQSGYGIASIIVGLIFMWPMLAIQIKRCHDRNRSGWFMLVFLIPLVNLWPAIEIAFLKGTDGPNRFGDDPLKNTRQIIPEPAALSEDAG
jgi:uncharacterized membrane protein YhaH (DUF805 family)